MLDANDPRCLLDVLERKQWLRPVPAFPGVRPVELTSKRLERIMQLGQGCRQRTPWWCWSLGLLLAAATLPGAAWVAGQEPKPQPLPPLAIVPDAQPVGLALPPVPWTPTQPHSKGIRQPQPLGPLVTRICDIAECLDAVRAEYGGNANRARDFLADQIRAVGGGDWATLGVDVVMQKDGQVVVHELGDDPDKPELRLKGKQAIVRHDQQGHQRIARFLDQTGGIHQQIIDLLEQLRRLQNVQVTLETRVLGLPNAFFERIGIDAQVDVQDTSAGDRKSPFEGDHTTLSDIETFFLLQAANGGHARITRLPKITLFNGQTASLSFGNDQAPYALRFQTVVSEDRRSVRLSYAAGEDANDDVLKKQSPLKIADGQTLLINPTDKLTADQLGWANNVGVPMLSKVPYVNRLFKNTSVPITHIFILVTPHIIIQQEEETRVGSLPK